MEDTEAGPNVQESSSEDKEVKQLMRAAKYVKSAIGVSLWESNGVENSSDAVEYSTAEPRPQLKPVDLIRCAVVC